MRRRGEDDKEAIRYDLRSKLRGSRESGAFEGLHCGDKKVGREDESLVVVRAFVGT